MITSETLILESEAGFKALFQHATVGILVAGDKGRIELVNPIIEKLFGYSNAELIGQNIEILIPPNLQQIHQIYRNKYFEKPQVRPMGRGSDLYAIHKNGTTFPVEISLGHYELDGNRLAVAFITDITERKISETRFQEESEWLRFLTDAMNRLWNIRKLKDGLEEILATSMELLQTSMGNIQLLEPQKSVLIIAAQKGFNHEFLDHFKEVSATSNSVCGLAFRSRKQVVIDDVENEPFFASHLQIARKSGFRTVQSTPLYDHEGSPIAMISAHSPEPGHFSNQSLQRMELYARYAEGFLERMKHQDTVEGINRDLEEKVEKRTDELANALAREKELNQMKTAFVSIASHEFRTPLSAILSSASLAQKYITSEQQDKRDKHLNRIKSSVNILVDILNDFLSLEQIEQGKVYIEKTRFDLNDFFQEVREELQTICKVNQTINYPNTEVSSVILDRKILRNIVLNLLSNAIKYSEDNIDLKAEIDDEMVKITIADKGIGIPAGEQEKLFDKFYRASNATNIQGTGLGLSIVKRYVELHDGTINFASKQNQGTTFIVTLPMKDNSFP